MTMPKIPSAVRRKAQALLASELRLDELTPAFKEEEKKNKLLREELDIMLTDLGYSSIDLDGIGKLRPMFMGPYASLEKNEDGSVNDDALNRFRTFCEKNGIYDTIFRASPNMQRVSGLVKEALEGSAEMPPGLTHYLLKGISFTRDSAIKRKTR